jgi:hypothetical protein
MGALRQDAKTWGSRPGWQNLESWKNRNLVKFGYTTHPLKENHIVQHSF